MVPPRGGTALLHRGNGITHITEVIIKIETAVKMVTRKINMVIKIIAKINTIKIIAKIKTCKNQNE